MVWYVILYFGEQAKAYRIGIFQLKNTLNDPEGKLNFVVTYIILQRVVDTK